MTAFSYRGMERLSFRFIITNDNLEFPGLRPSYSETNSRLKHAYCCVSVSFRKVHWFGAKLRWLFLPFCQFHFKISWFLVLLQCHHSVSYRGCYLQHLWSKISRVWNPKAESEHSSDSENVDRNRKIRQTDGRQGFASVSTLPTTIPLYAVFLPRITIKNRYIIIFS